VVGDSARLRQILLNLLNNSVKFTDTGEIVLTFERGPDREPGTLALHGIVRDTGIGIPADKIDRLFQSFSQADAATNRKYGGTGLGLAISKRLAELMNGTMWVESEGIPGHGSRFHMDLALGISETKTAPAPSHTHLVGHRVLAVDDNSTNNRLVSRHASAWGMEVALAASGPEALSILEREPSFDVVVLDFMMPGMDGLDLALEIRKRWPKLPLVLLSSVALAEVKHDPRFAQANFTQYLAKPLKPASLRSSLMAALGEVEDGTTAPTSAQELDPHMAEAYPLRILLTEDNAVNQKLALKLLEKMGYPADVAGNGIEAIESLERQTYDVILMDVQMPEMDGLEATRRIIERWGNKRPQIIAMTADAMQGDRERCLEAGMDEYLTKPIRTAELVGALERAATLSTAGALDGALRDSDDMAPPGPAVDKAVLDRLVASMGGDPAFVAELIEEFDTDAPKLVGELKRGISEGNVEVVHRAAHTMKSNASTFGADELATLCAELEAAAKGGSLERGPELLAQIESAYATAGGELQQARKELLPG
jgi:CheY-like chemotaxis protein/HPt (histidine-containing phosphotransfer) domain-containing protein